MEYSTMAKTVILAFSEFIKDKVNLDQDREQGRVDSRQNLRIFMNMKIAKVDIISFLCSFLFVNILRITTNQLYF